LHSHCPAVLQVSGQTQIPQAPPQPSSPQTRPEQLGTQPLSERIPSELFTPLSYFCLAQSSWQEESSAAATGSLPVRASQEASSMQPARQLSLAEHSTES
jgi:hypothetical protein